MMKYKSQTENLSKFSIALLTQCTGSDVALGWAYVGQTCNELSVSVTKYSDYLLNTFVHEVLINLNQF
jgi:hypothetical protein